MNIGSKEFYINMKDVPKWNDLYTYEEQDDDVKQFWENEAKKLMNGVTINGVFIHPWLYWHLNFWNIMIDVGDQRFPSLPKLRDNEWMFTEFLTQAEKENKGIFMFGTRRFGKALLNSEVLYMEDGEKMIGDIVAGDKIYDHTGKLVTVLEVFPQGKVPTYRVVFEDGRNVVCCGNHLWKIKHKGSWTVKNLKYIIASDYKNISIPIGEAINYPTAKLPMPPSAYGSMLASYVAGKESRILFERSITKKYLRSSPIQKRLFIESFIRYFKGVITGEDRIPILNIDRSVLYFIQRMFWSYGWSAKMENQVLVVSNIKKELKIKEIYVHGKEDATCIAVDSRSKLFLTTNYIVTHNTVIMSSYLARNATMTYNLSHNVVAPGKEDLMSLSEYMEFGFDNIHPYLKINRTGNDWFKEVILGTKNVNNERDVHARIRMTNIDQGKSSSALKTAGGTPYTTIYDEVGKYPVLGPYLAGRPAHMANGRMRGMILMAGCCCAGTTVYKANGEPCNIEDLKQEDGILGYDFNAQKRVAQDIVWMKPPSVKHCYRIIAIKGYETKTLECSHDHPIACFYPAHRDHEYRGYVAASLLKEGDLIWGAKGDKKEIYYISHIEYIGEKEVYNLTASNTHTYIASDIITHNTGGNVDFSQDAQKIINDPEEYGFILMNYDILNKRTSKPTWRMGKSGCFVPAQMSHAYEKKKTTLAKYLGVDGAMLKKITMYESDFDKNADFIKNRLSELMKKDRALYIQERMAYPLSIDDCFLNSNVNRFPVEDALIHKNRLLEEGRPGKLVDIYQIENKKMAYNFSTKELAPFPFNGGNIDCPVVIYEDPPERGGVFDYVYCSGLDPYKQNKADTDSLGAFYILKRLVKINDPFAYRIVASYVARPGTIDDFCKNCEILIEAYGAKCLMENADRMFEIYLARKNKEMILLENGERVANRVCTSGTKQNNKIGLTPTSANQGMLYNTVLQYCWEEEIIGYNEDGTEITQKGIYRIPDIELLDEIIASRKGVNTDRIIAFGHALLLAKYYDDMGFMPDSRTQEANEERRKKRRINQIHGYVIRKRNGFKMR